MAGSNCKVICGKHNTATTYTSEACRIVSVVHIIVASDASDLTLDIVGRNEVCDGVERW